MRLNAVRALRAEPNLLCLELSVINLSVRVVLYCTLHCTRGTVQYCEGCDVQLYLHFTVAEAQQILARHVRR